jgi:hypothetical protein
MCVFIAVTLNFMETLSVPITTAAACTKLLFAIPSTDSESGVTTKALNVLLQNVLKSRSDPTSIFTEKNPICTAWKAQSAENARAAMHTSVRFLWKWRRMAVSGQLCRERLG